MFVINTEITLPTKGGEHLAALVDVFTTYLTFNDGKAEVFAYDPRYEIPIFFRCKINVGCTV